MLVDKASVGSRVDPASEVADAIGADKHTTGSCNTLGADDSEYVVHPILPEDGQIVCQNAR